VSRPAGLLLGPKDRREREGTRKWFFFFYFQSQTKSKKSMALIYKTNTSIINGTFGITPSNSDYLRKLIL
jgi:hypothetical protein